jgi:hypothetical protein
MSPTQPDSDQADPLASSGDTITIGSIVNSQAVAVGSDVVAQVFQQVLLPVPPEYRCLALHTWQRETHHWCCL